VQLEWTSTPGRTYQVQFKDSLAELEWQTADPATATTDTTAMTLPTAPAGQRFYRILRLE
jgi:hypothetical protein